MAPDRLSASCQIEINVIFGEQVPSFKAALDSRRVLKQLRRLATLRMSDIHGVLSSTALLSFSRCVPAASCVASIPLTLALPLFLLPSVTPAFLSSPKTLPSPPVPEGR